jgi:hypothetical protein
MLNLVISEVKRHFNTDRKAGSRTILCNICRCKLRARTCTDAESGYFEHYFVNESKQTLRNYANCSIILIFNHPGSKKSGYL